MIKKAAKHVKTKVENGSRKSILEDLFYDFHKSRRQVYLMNFFRGMAFGVGSVIGGTIVVALVVAILSLLVDIPGGVGEFIQYIVDTVNQPN
jgi:hypothetical protein